MSHWEAELPWACALRPVPGVLRGKPGVSYVESLVNQGSSVVFSVQEPATRTRGSNQLQYQLRGVSLGSLPSWCAMFQPRQRYEGNQLGCCLSVEYKYIISQDPKMPRLLGHTLTHPQACAGPPSKCSAPSAGCSAPTARHALRRPR